MKHQTFNRTKSRIIQQQADESIETGVLADSLEVLENHLQLKIRKLEDSLNQLNLLDNPVEIIECCLAIKQQRTLLAKLTLKRKRASYLC